MATEITVELTCSFSPHDEDRTEVTLLVPDGWETQYGEIGDDRSFCPEHVGVKPFLEDQCPGCVSGWGECELWSSFVFDDTYHRTLTESNFDQLESGICPRRHGGTFLASHGNGPLERIDLSIPAVRGGHEMAVAIREYIERYPTKESSW